MPNIVNDKKKVALITGAARRIGAVIAQHFHSNDYNIIIHYRNSYSEAKELSSKLNLLRPDSAKIIEADLGRMVDDIFVKQFTEQLISYYGKLDVLVNNASSFFATPIGTIQLEDWRDLMISNAGGAFFLAQSLSPYLKATGGSIINISDIHAKRPLGNYSVYSIAKAANDMVTKSLAIELAPEVRVNGVAPGTVLWPEAKNELDDDTKNKLIKKTLLNSIATPEEVAKAVLFFAESKHITGQILEIDAGRSLRG